VSIFWRTPAERLHFISLHSKDIESQFLEEKLDVSKKYYSAPR
jgi:hypothetical protein